MSGTTSNLVAVGSRGIGSFDLNYYQVRSERFNGRMSSLQSTDISRSLRVFHHFSSPTPSIFGGGNLVTYEKVLIELLNNAGNPNTRRTKFDVKWKNGGADSWI